MDKKSDEFTFSFLFGKVSKTFDLQYLYPRGSGHVTSLSRNHR